MEIKFNRVNSLPLESTEGGVYFNEEDKQIYLGNDNGYTPFGISWYEEKSAIVGTAIVGSSTI